MKKVAIGCLAVIGGLVLLGFLIIVIGAVVGVSKYAAVTPSIGGGSASSAGGESRPQSGTLIVGKDIQPGTYQSKGGSGCYWERSSSFGGGGNDILANDNAAGPVIVTIDPSDKAFKISGCAAFAPDGAALTTSPTAPLSSGTYRVGRDVAPGTWRSDASSGCYWARLSNFSGSGNINANDNARGQAVVTITARDAGFLSSHCGTWTYVGN